MGDISYLTMADAVKSVYGSDSDIWTRVAFGGVAEQDWSYLQQVPGVSIVRSASGKFLGYDYTNPFPASSNPASIVDSNLQTGMYGVGSFDAQLPATVNTDPQTGLITSFESGAKTVSTGSKVMSLAGDIGLAVGATALGIKAGKFIDSALYSLAPDFWDEVCPTLNPETWGEIITEDMEGAPLFRAVFGIDDNDNTTMYMDEKALAYMYAVLLANGAYSESGEATISDTTGLDMRNMTIPFKVGHDFLYSGYWNENKTISISGDYEIGMQYSYISGNNITIQTVVASKNPFTFTRTINGSSTTYSGSSTTINGQTFYSLSTNNTFDIRRAYTLDPACNTTGFNSLTASTTGKGSISYIMLYGTVTQGSLEGVSDNPDAGIHINPTTVINQTTGNPVTPQDDIDDILEALKLAYPALFADSIYEDILQEDGTIERHTYIPTPLPTEDENGNPVTKETPGIDPQQNPEINPETAPESELQGITDSLTESPTTPDTGGGVSPPLVPVVGTGSSLWKIYNPTQAEVDAFGAWLWTDNFIEQIKKLFNNPMEAIIGIHKVFATPSTGGTTTIKCGYLDSGVSSKWVSDQYTTINCGTVNLFEYFGNVFDYTPYTRIHLYLPFIGIVELDTGDVMRSSISITYHVDVLTGACLAEVYVHRDGAGGIIYQYSGSCIVNYPLTSGSYASAIMGALSIVGSGIAAVVSGGALAPVAAMGAVSGLSHLHADVQKSGGFSGSAGAMGIKIPYIIVSRPQTALADNFPHFTGLPANSTVTLEHCSGHVRVKSIYTENIPQATDGEKRMIEDLLKTGVLI